MAEKDDVNASINWHYSDEVIRVILTIPGIKTVWAGPPNKRKLDHDSATVDVTFPDNEARVRVQIKQGTLTGKVYEKTLTKDDLKDNLVAPNSTYKVDDDQVRLYIRKR